jgi:hypothetical protein
VSIATFADDLRYPSIACGKRGKKRGKYWRRRECFVSNCGKRTLGAMPLRVNE